MKATILGSMVLACLLPSHLGIAQPEPAVFPLAGDWEGLLVGQDAVHHLVIHLNTTPEGKMTALLDLVDQKISGMPAIGGSFDGSRLVLRFFYWKPNNNRDLEYKVSSYEATVEPSGAGMTGIWIQDGTWPLKFKRMTWQAKVPKPAPATIFDGDWEGVEYEARGIKIRFIFHIHNTEDGLMALVDCPEERFKGALASKVSYNVDSREISITMGQSVFTGKMTADGKALDTSMAEPGYHFLIHFDRLIAAP